LSESICFAEKNSCYTTLPLITTAGPCKVEKPVNWSSYQCAVPLKVYFATQNIAWLRG